MRLLLLTALVLISLVTHADSIGQASGDGPSSTASPAPEDTNSDPARGAHRVMATFYQSCNVLKAPPFDVDEDRGLSEILTTSHEQAFEETAIRRIIPPGISQAQLVQKDFYLSKISQPGIGCYDARKAPPLYYLAGSPDKDLLNNENKLDITTLRQVHGSQPYRGIDCAGFVSSALAVEGLNIEPPDDSVNPPVDCYRSHFTYTGDFLYAGMNNPQHTDVKCLEPIHFSNHDSIRRGDIFTIPGHMFMVDSVGKDPFGFKKFPGLTKRDCGTLANRLSPDDLNFSIIMSTGYGNIGVSRFDAKFYFRKRPESFMKLGLLIQQACHGMFEPSGGEVARVLDPKGNPIMNLIRHVGNKKPGCVSDKRPQLVGEDCVKSCDRSLD